MCELKLIFVSGCNKVANSYYCSSLALLIKIVVESEDDTKVYGGFIVSQLLNRNTLAKPLKPNRNSFIFKRDLNR